MNRKDIIEFGFKIKRFLDFGRVLYLKNFDYDAKLIYYCGKEISLENTALVATKNSI